MEELLLGGQAVIEGVMMKSSKYYAVATRDKNGKIIIDTKEFKSLRDKLRIFNLPILRGVISLFEMMILGIRTLTYSANLAAEDMDENLSTWEIFITITLSLLFAVALFVVLPLFLSGLFADKNSVLFNVVDGVLRLLLFIGYVVLISFLEDVKTLFEYHGAEHKAVHAYEKKQKLSVQNAKKHSRLHPRCGTSFVLIVLIISIIVFSIFNPEGFLYKFLIRILLIPLIAGLSYELLKLSAKNQKKALFRTIVYPGLLIQKLTTREPTDKQLEVAIRSLRKILVLEGKKV
ncbi:DUF1385 domain-containing protein [Candidatus Woesearchaeota archaeon]|nr:DUF1385 domain-containing protein [Candidatus Woesearchaeota archaeon]